MPDASNRYEVVHQADAGPPRDLSAEQLAEGTADRSWPTPKGWTATSGHSVDLDVVLRSTGGAHGSLTGEVPTVHVVLSRGSETLELDVADVRSDAARAWADALLREGIVESVPAGRAIVGGPAALVDQEWRLVWATYNDGTAVKGLAASRAIAREESLEGPLRGLISTFDTGR